MLDKSYIYTLNVCATQELHKIITQQQNVINSLTENVNDLLNRVSILENTSNIP